jgi:putative endonuclease
MADTQKKGRTAEQLALRYLKKQGLTLLKKNYHGFQGQYLRGEIDLIMKDSDYLVFIEVRMRLNKYFTKSLESINYQKQRRLIHAAKQYLLDNEQFNDTACRFDAVGIDHHQQIIWIKNAFQV